MFRKIYLEITNVCNLRCSFCPGTTRQPMFLSAERFRILAEKLVGHTEYLYLHVMGEPLLHPELAAILDIAASLGFRICLTTNGILLPVVSGMLLSRAASIYKVSISLHSHEANGGGDPESYLRDCVTFQKAAGQAGIIAVLRLWNLTSNTAADSTINRANDRILALLHETYPDPWQEVRGGSKMAKGCYLEWGEKFTWPVEKAAEPDGAGRFCMALRDQAAVLCDGTVVPCCLDSEGEIALGNLFDISMEKILDSPRARAIFEGFSRRRAVEPFCQTCGYATRFS